MVISSEKGCKDCIACDRICPGQSSDTLKSVLLRKHILEGGFSSAWLQPPSYMVSWTKSEWAPIPEPPSLMCSLPRRPGQSVLGCLAITSITAAATGSYLVQLHLIRRPPPSSQGAGALVCWHNHDVIPPGKEASVSTGPWAISLEGHQKCVSHDSRMTYSFPCPLSSKRAQWGKAWFPAASENTAISTH